jgi:hypothetical protein
MPSGAMLDSQPMEAPKATPTAMALAKLEETEKGSSHAAWSTVYTASGVSPQYPVPALVRVRPSGAGLVGSPEVAPEVEDAACLTKGLHAGVADGRPEALAVGELELVVHP